jgi:hypothetical protein
MLPRFENTKVENVKPKNHRVKITKQLDTPSFEMEWKSHGFIEKEREKEKKKEEKGVFKKRKCVQYKKEICCLNVQTIKV